MPEEEKSRQPASDSASEPESDPDMPSEGTTAPAEKIGKETPAASADSESPSEPGASENTKPQRDKQESPVGEDNKDSEPDAKAEATLAPDSDAEFEASAKKPTSKKDSDSDHTAPPTKQRSHWPERIGGGRFVPFSVVLVLGVAALVYFVANPHDSNISEIKSIAGGEKSSIEHVIHNSLHLGSMIAATILLAWLLLSPWWARRKAPDDDSTARDLSAGIGPTSLLAKRSSDDLSRTWFWLIVLTAVVAGGLLRTPGLSQSLWNDEEVAYRKFIHGSYQIDESGAAKWKPVSWERTWFYNVTGNNHVLQSVGSRLTIDLFGDGTDRVEERLARALPFAAGLLTIVALAALLWQSGAGFAGALAAWILALHPWHLRYSAEARGYSGMLLFAVLALLLLGIALHRKTWLCWFGFGVCQLACLLCFPAAIYVIATLNLGIVIHLARRRDIENLRRWSTVCVVGAAVFIQIMTPSFLRMLEWIGSPYEAPRPINSAWFIDLWSHVAAGLPISDGHEAKAFQLDLEAWKRQGSARFWLLAIILPALSILGCVLAVLRYPRLRWPLIGILVAFGFTLVHLLVKPMVFHSWYLLTLLVPFCIGLATPASVIAQKYKPLGWLTACATLLVFAGVTASPILRQREFPRHPIREAAFSVRGDSPADSTSSKNITTIAIGHGAGQFTSYDPRAKVASNESQFAELLRQARNSGQRIFVYCIDQQDIAGKFPRVGQQLTDPQAFRKVSYHYGVEAFWSIAVYEFIEDLGTANSSD